MAAPSEAAPEFEISLAGTEPVPEAVEEVAISDNPAVTATPVIPAAAKVTSVPSGLFFHGAPPQPAAIASNETAEFAVPAPDEAAEIDLSSEWEQDLPATTASEVSQEPAPEIAEEESKPVEVATTAPAPPIPNLDESIEEVRFYLGQGMTDQAEAVLGRLEALLPGAPELAVLRLGIESAKQITPPEPEPQIAVEEQPAAEEKTHDTLANAQPWPSERPVLQDIVSELEDSLGDGFLGESKSTHASDDVS